MDTIAVSTPAAAARIQPEATIREPDVLAEPALETVASAFAGAPHRIGIECAQALRLPAADLVAIGGIVREAIANAFQHAFPAGRQGHVWIRLVHEAGRVVLTVRDDGVGMPDLPREPGGGCGLIRTLADSLGGYARLGSAPFGGALVSVVYPRMS